MGHPDMRVRSDMLPDFFFDPGAIDEYFLAFIYAALARILAVDELADEIPGFLVLGQMGVHEFEERFVIFIDTGVVDAPGAVGVFGQSHDPFAEIPFA